jgi:hypothetical protein
MAPYINSKLTPFLTNDIMRPIIGQPKSSINFADILNNKKIFIVNLSKGILGDTNSYLIGMVMVGKIASAAFARAAIPKEERKDFYLYADEFQNITTDTIPKILSELRKYRLSFVMAHQFIAQVKENIRDSIFGNVGTMVAFRISDQDGEILKKYFAPVFNETDLVNISNYNAYMRLMLDGEPSRAFNIKSIMPETQSISYRNEVVDSSNMRYGKLRDEVNKEIMERFNKNKGGVVEEASDNEEGEDTEFDEEFLNEILESMKEEDKK